MSGPLVLKLGGELLETPHDRRRIAALAGAIAVHRPLVVVHGGGRAIDAELDRRAIAPKKVDGLRVTDKATLDVVVSVLAGTSNTELVAAMVAIAVKNVQLFLEARDSSVRDDLTGWTGGPGCHCSRFGAPPCASAATLRSTRSTSA